MKSIPKFNNASEQTRVIGGLSCSVRRLSAGAYFPFFSRLLADVGPLVARVLSNPDDDLDPAIESLIKSIMPGGTGLGMGKLSLVLQALESAKNIDIGWYAQTLLIGQLSIEGVAIDTMAELDETGIAFAQIVEILSLAFVANVNPTSAGPNTANGTGVKAAKQNATSGTSNLRGATNTAGQSAPTSPTAGRYSV